MTMISNYQYSFVAVVKHSLHEIAFHMLMCLYIHCVSKISLKSILIISSYKVYLSFRDTVYIIYYTHLFTEQVR